MFSPAPFPSPTKRWHTTAQPSTSPLRPALSAAGKSVFITGGGDTGIGGATARHFAQAGASRIALLGRRAQPLLANKAHIEAHFAGVEVWAIPGDVTAEGDMDAAFARFAGNGKIDVLVHSAAAVGPRESVLDADPGAYLEAVRSNVAGSLFVARAFARYAAPGAVAVAINSWGAHLSVNDAFGAYCVAKMAVFRLWDTVARVRPDISVFHTQPGVVLTQMNLETGGAASVEGVQTDDVSLPASFNVWLASPEARFLRGKFLWCNWDVDELKAQAKEIEAGTKLNIGLVGWPFENDS
ncbi:hypothetical protein F4810DRAFT_706290 [Camillea tinctor]|nr:hypothetical protein F4810DRAFT_706290 [Camillea tinctor]